MNREHVLFHLQEAAEELTRTVSECESNSQYDIGEYFVAMQHLYHHLNMAWNGRYATKEEADPITDETFNA